MPAKPAIVEKDYTSAFALDKAKLSRMLNILEERFKTLQLPINSRYTVWLSNDKKIELTSLEELFKLDNTIRNPVKSLSIKAAGSTDEAKVESLISYSSNERDNISVRVVSSESNLALQLFAELEEQVERTFLNDLIYRFFKSRFAFLYLSAILVALAGIFAPIAVLFFIPTRTSSDLPTEVVDALIQKSTTAITLEDKVDFLFELNARQLEAQTKSSPRINLQDFLNLRTLFGNCSGL